MQPEESGAGGIGDDDAADGNAIADCHPIDGRRQVGGHLQHIIRAGGRGEKHRWLIAVGADAQRGCWRQYG